jgi:hypothetical protein
MEPIYNKERDAITPLFCFIYNHRICRTLSSTNNAIAQLFLPTIPPNAYAPYHFKKLATVRIPESLDEEKDKFLFSFIAQSRTSSNQPDQQLVISLLTQVCT